MLFVHKMRGCWDKFLTFRVNPLQSTLISQCFWPLAVDLDIGLNNKCTRVLGLMDGLGYNDICIQV